MSSTAAQVTSAIKSRDAKTSQANSGNKPYPTPENSFIDILLHGDKLHPENLHTVQLKIGLAKHLKTFIRGKEVRVFFTLDDNATIYCMVGYSDESIHEQWFSEVILEVKISAETGAYSFL